MKAGLSSIFLHKKLKAYRVLDFFGKGFMDRYHWGRLFVFIFGKFYSLYEVDHKVHVEHLVNELRHRYDLQPFQIIRAEQSEKDNVFTPNQELSEIALILKKELLVVVFEWKVEIYYGAEISGQEISELLNLTDQFGCTADPGNYAYLIYNTKTGYELTEFPVKKTDVDFDLLYNDNFVQVNQFIINALCAKSRNGIILLHGKQGTGKTYYLRHLIKCIDRKFIYFPLHMAEFINSPEFLPFISAYTRAVIILEDCENLLRSRDSRSGNTSVLANILNIGDGLLSEALDLNVICTFNTALSHIDAALLRKGRLLACYEFKELEKGKAQKLATVLDKKSIVDRPMTLSDIFHLDEGEFDQTSRNPVGFNRT